MKKIMSLLLTVLLLFGVCGLVSAQDKPKYTFYDVFWDATDPNMSWFTTGAKDFMKKYPRRS